MSLLFAAEVVGTLVDRASRLRRCWLSQQRSATTMIAR